MCTCKACNNLRHTHTIGTMNIRCVFYVLVESQVVCLEIDSLLRENFEYVTNMYLKQKTKYDIYFSVLFKIFQFDVHSFCTYF